jgi:proton glutamate symport protein
MRLSLAQWMLAAMALGVAFGLSSPELAQRMEAISNIFLRLIKSIIAPVLFGVLVSSIASSASLAELGRLGWKSVLYFEAVTTIALAMGWAAIAVFRPGDGVHIAVQQAAAPPALSFAKVIEASFPTSIFDAMARGDVLQIVIFCMLFGVACHAVGPRRAGPVTAFAEAIAQIAFRYTRYVMYLAPIGVFAAMSVTVARSGWTSLKGLALFIAAAWITQILYMVLVQGGSLLIARVPIATFAKFAKEPFLVAFATTSSAAALPQTLENMERFGVPKRIVAVVTPMSLTFNMSGSCIHLAMCAFFVAQATGMVLSTATTIFILLTLKLTSKGVAGIPRANFVILSGLFATFGLAPEGLTVLLGIDAIIDMIRTSVNVMGHCVASPVIARWEAVTIEQ